MDTLLVVEDKESMQRLLRQLFVEAGYAVEVTGSAEQAIALLSTHKVFFPVVITDFKLPGKNGLEVLAAVKNFEPRSQVILLTAYGTVEMAVMAMKAGAFDFLTKPFDNDHLLLLVQRALEMVKLKEENLSLRETVKLTGKGSPLVGISPSFKQAIALANKVAVSDATVFLTGESGTGKELFARHIHSLSAHKDGPFVAVSCAALAEGILESELFGHEKGSFTGAAGRHLGRFELARGGTLFLDEVGEISPAIQVKLLRILQEKKFERVGGMQTLEAQFRLVTATNQDLLVMSREKKFREDLYYRLAVFPLTLPPLRTRKEDIEVLAKHFVTEFNKEKAKKIEGISPEAMALLNDYSWPGNVRELQNVIERALILCQESTLQKLDFSFIRPERAPGIASKNNNIKSLGKLAKLEAERLEIDAALKKSGGNKSMAARALGISYKTLLNRLKD